MLEDKHLSKHFSFLLFKCLSFFFFKIQMSSHLFIYRMVFPSLCHLAGPLLKCLQQIIHPVWCPDLKNYSFLRSQSGVSPMRMRFLVSNLSPHAIDSLLLPINRKPREHFSPESEELCWEYPFLWGQLLKCFPGNSVRIVYSEMNDRLFRSGKDLKTKTKTKTHRQKKSTTKNMPSNPLI